MSAFARASVIDFADQILKTFEDFRIASTLKINIDYDR